RIRSYNLDHSLAGEGIAWSASVQQSFEWPGRLSLRKAIANQDVTLAELGLARFRSALAGRIRGLALDLAAATEQDRAAREVANRLQALREVLVQRDPAGITPALEIRVLEATELTLRRRATEAGLAADHARTDLNLLRGRPADAPLALARIDPDPGPLPPLVELAAAAATNNFEVRTRAVELAQQGFRVELTRQERWPAFKVGPSYTHEDGSNLDRLLALAVSFPLPLWKNGEANVEAARARQVQAETSLNAARREVERALATAARTYGVKSAELALWREDSLRHFREAAELADRHYRLGAVPAPTYVELQKQYLDAVETLLATRRDLLAAALELEQLTGLALLRPAAAAPGPSTQPGQP
ncbi:MAG: TolC family protein, partial [Verrucomicrobiota bacterium]